MFLSDSVCHRLKYCAELAIKFILELVAVEVIQTVCTVYVHKTSFLSSFDRAGMLARWNHPSLV